MRIQIVQIVFFLAFLLVGVNVVGQDITIKNEVKSLFDNPEKDLWITHYTGTIDKKFPIEFWIGHDGNEYHALLRYTQDKDKIYYDGTYTKSETIKLDEFASDGDISATMLLESDGDRLTGTLSLKNSIDSYDVTLNEVNTAVDPAEICGREKQVTVYEGIVDDQIMTVKMYKNTTKRSVVIITQNEIIEETVDVDDTYINYTLIEESSLSGSKIRTSKDELFVERSGNIFSLPIVDQLGFTCTADGSYKSQYYLVVPSVSGKRWNTWTKNLENTLHASKSSGEYTADDRMNSWTGLDINVTYYSDDLISGDVFLFDENGSTVQSFIYDRRKDRILDAATVMVLEPLIDQTEMKQPVHVSLSDRGIVFQSDFDPVYGQQKKVVAFSDVAPSTIKHRKIKKLIR